jgi:hypothetical protein
MPVAAPEQIVAKAGVAVTTGIGFTKIGTSIGEPIHAPKVGLMV